MIYNMTSKMAFYADYCLQACGVAVPSNLLPTDRLNNKGAAVWPQAFSILTSVFIAACSPCDPKLHVEDRSLEFNKNIDAARI